MSEKRTILTTLGSYVDKRERPSWGWKGEEVEVHEDYVEDFDKGNVENGTGEEIVYPRVGVDVISPLAVQPSDEEEDEAAAPKKAAPAKK